MDEIKAIQKRINGGYKHNRIYVLGISALLLIAIVMGTLIYGKSNPDAKIFGYSIADINNRFDNWFGGLFKTNTSESKEETVSTTIKYTYLGNNYYKSEDQSVNALFEGVVNNVSKQDDMYYVLISYNNGVTAQYFELTEAIVKVNDHVLTNDSLGVYEEKFKALFMKNNKVISYEETLL